MITFNYSFKLKHPSPNFDLCMLGDKNAPFRDASLCVLYGTSWFAEFREHFGYLVLVLQELEHEIKSTVDYMKQAFEKYQIPEYFEVDPKDASFEVLIEMFSSQLDQSPGSRELIHKLHEARKYRNRLAHRFLDAGSLKYHLSAGGRKKTIHNLKLRTEYVIALVMAIHRVGRAYATDIGLSDEVLRRASELNWEQLGVDEDIIIEYMCGCDKINTEAQEPED